MKNNLISTCEDVVRIVFSNKTHGYAEIDKEDYHLVENFCWHRETRGKVFYARAYVRGSSGKDSVYLHQSILPTEDGIIAEHKDGNGLNNKKSNLRPANRSQNEMNKGVSLASTSGVTGVSLRSDTKKWRAYIKLNGRQLPLGSYKNKEDAIKARKKAEEKYFGEHSFDNSRGING